MHHLHGSGVVDGGTSVRSLGPRWPRAKFVLVIGIAVLDDNLALETESVDGGGVLMGGSDADDSDGGSITGESLGMASVGWDTSGGGKDVIITSSQSSRMMGRCAV